MWQSSPLRVERVVERIFQKVDERRRVDVGKTTETTSEIGRVVVCSEEAAETCIEQFLHCLSRHMHTQRHFYLTEKKFRSNCTNVTETNT